MTLHPDDLRYWLMWTLGLALCFLVARWYLVEPILDACRTR